MGTDHHITLAYSKQENGIVERSNKEILRHLKAIIYERDILTRWSRYLPMVQRIINSTISTSLRGRSSSTMIVLVLVLVLLLLPALTTNC